MLSVAGTRLNAGFLLSFQRQIKAGPLRVFKDLSFLSVQTQSTLLAFYSKKK